MTSDQLTGCRILIVEDEYFLADDARTVLSEAGADVLGPVGSVQDAEAMIASEPVIDAVLLDVNLRGEMAFDVADLLQSRNIPIAFMTGYDQAALPERFAARPRLQKPVSAQALVGLLEGIAKAGTTSSGN